MIHRFCGWCGARGNRDRGTGNTAEQRGRDGAQKDGLRCLDQGPICCITICIKASWCSASTPINTGALESSVVLGKQELERIQREQEREQARARRQWEEQEREWEREEAELAEERRQRNRAMWNQIGKSLSEIIIKRNESNETSGSGRKTPCRSRELACVRSDDECERYHRLPLCEDY